jgi:hypothetical protein
LRGTTNGGHRRLPSGLDRMFIGTRLANVAAPDDLGAPDLIVKWRSGRNRHDEQNVTKHFRFEGFVHDAGAVE